jgi:redox-sensitive bicupin YhaK (pirin superfamily)
MITLRKSSERGQADHGWLQSWHSFSFADYYDPAHVHYGVLRVINEDYISPSMGFGTHPHRDMEILTYMLDGELEHRDSMGNGSIIRAGDVQRMSAGSGVLHSEFNPSPDTVSHLLQIWVLTAQKGVAPSYEEARVPDDEKNGQLRLIAAPAGQGGVVSIGQDVRIWAGCFDGAQTQSLPVRERCYVHLARGSLNVNGVVLNAGDAAMLDHEATVILADGATAEVLVFDLP